MTPRFERAKNALYDAFFNGTLAKGTCTACAVGNIVAAGQGGTLYRSEILMKGWGCTTQNDYWQQLFCTSWGEQFRQSIPLLEKDLIKDTGYNADELAQVEFAFEQNTKIFGNSYREYTEQEILEDQYRGLCAAFDVLMQLDGIVGDPVKERLRDRLITSK